MVASILLLKLPLLLKLIIAHVLTDFFFQPTSWVADKKAKKYGSKYLYLHTIVCFILSWLAIGDLSLWRIALSISLSHQVIDITKLYLDKKNRIIWFLGDQIIHIAILLGVWLWLINDWQAAKDLVISCWHSSNLIIIVLAYMLVLTPSGILIRIFTDRWVQQITPDTISTSSLQDAGRYIGWFERLLVLTFVLLKQYEPIGLLIAAKSILRFKDTERKESEYVVIGTLISFSIAILIGLMAQKIIG